MDSISQKTLQQMMNNLKDAAEMRKRHREYEEKTSIAQYCMDLQKLGIDFTEEAVVKKYKQLEDFSEVLDYFYYKDEFKWKAIDSKRNTSFNSDSQYDYVKRIVEKHFDTKKVSDPFFIDDAMHYIEKECPKEKIQDEVLLVIERLINYANKKQINTLKDISEYYDINLFMKFYIKKCHNRNTAFKELMKKFYDTFEDADRSIYKIK